jgi:hypothetical protein
MPTLSKGFVNAAKTNATRTWYTRKSQTSGELVGYVFKASADNPVIALSYTSFSDFLVKGPGLYAGPPERRFAVFGTQTPASQIPRAGKGTWQGIARGYGDYPVLGWSGEVFGKSTLVADFDQNTSRLTLALKTGEAKPRALSPIVMDGFVSTGANQIAGYDYKGRFFGPNDAEFGAAWIFSVYDAGYVNLAGIAVGKRIN